MISHPSSRDTLCIRTLPGQYLTAAAPAIRISGALFAPGRPWNIRDNTGNRPPCVSKGAWPFRQEHDPSSQELFFASWWCHGDPVCNKSLSRMANCSTIYQRDKMASGWFSSRLEKTSNRGFRLVGSRGFLGIFLPLCKVGMCDIWILSSDSAVYTPGIMWLTLHVRTSCKAVTTFSIDV